MKKNELEINDIRDLVFDDASLLGSDEDIALHVMHRFNIDRDTIDTLPAFDGSLQNILRPEKE